jgi:hypothetical protein
VELLIKVLVRKGIITIDQGEIQESEEILDDDPFVANHSGFSLHAGVVTSASNREQLEKIVSLLDISKTKGPPHQVLRSPIRHRFPIVWEEFVHPSLLFSMNFIWL